MTDETLSFNDLGELVCYAAEQVLVPPQRITVSEAAEKYRYLDNEGSYVGPYLNEQTPYLVEPMNVLTDREFESMILIAPAQAGKTEMILNWVSYSACCDPADMLIIQTARDTARDFSYRRIDKMHRDSKAVGERLRPGNDNDNIYDKFYRNGMMLSLGWPTINQLSGRPVPRVGFTDYDRMPQDIEKNGPPFPLGRKRTTSFNSFGMTMAESSPSFDVLDPKWKAKTDHEYPPTLGIGGLYNEGDRRCFYWACPNCGERFEPKFSLLTYDRKIPDPFEAALTTQMTCPTNGCLIDSKHKFAMNLGGVWLRDGQKMTAKGEIIGLGARSRSASFWLRGPAARFITWQTLVERFLLATQNFERTGDTRALKATINTDQGEAFWPLNNKDDIRLPEDLKARSAKWADKKVPYGTRFLLAAVDIQKSYFVVQVFGVGPSMNMDGGFDTYLIDRFDIEKSKRVDDDGDHPFVKPYAFLEDWDLITEQVVDREYELEDGTGLMSIKMTAVDSGGKSGTTTKAYDWWRKLRTEGKHNRVLLVKGEPKFGAPRAEIDYPDSDRKDRSAGARGEIPVLFLNSNVLKDQLLGMSDRDTPGGKMNFNKWTPDKVFVEMTTEIKNDKGQWINPSGRRNEAWDLGYYMLGLCAILKVEKLNWDEPEDWYDEWSNNSLVRTIEQPKPFAQSATTDYGFAKFGALLG